MPAACGKPRLPRSCTTARRLRQVLRPVRNQGGRHSGTGWRKNGELETGASESCRSAGRVQPRPAHCGLQGKGGRCGRGLAQEVCQRRRRRWRRWLQRRGGRAVGQGSAAADGARRGAHSGLARVRHAASGVGEPVGGGAGATTGRPAACWGQAPAWVSALASSEGERSLGSRREFARSLRRWPPRPRTGRGCGREQLEVAPPPPR